MDGYIKCLDAKDFLNQLPDKSVDLFLIDPPYYQIVKDSWDNQWATEKDYVDWLVALFKLARTKVKPSGSLISFGAIGKHGSHPFWKIILQTEEFWQYRNSIVWGKRRAYGKPKDYLFTREEIVWFTADKEKNFTFNIPLLDEKRGYAGFNAKYPAKSEYKRVSNVWTDINELFRPTRYCEKPGKLLDRLILTHSNPQDLVVDFFAGSGSTILAAVRNGRYASGCEAIEADAKIIEEKIKKCQLI